MTFETHTYNATATNILLIAVDDVGQEQFSSLGWGFDGGASWYPPQGDFFEKINDHGLYFSRFLTAPNCSTTRAMYLTGRHSFRTGIGDITNYDDPWFLPPAEALLPTVLDLNTTPNYKYSHAFFGKWHLTNSVIGGRGAPNIYGFNHYAGSIENIPRNRTGFAQASFEKTVNGEVKFSYVYSLSDQVDDVLGWVKNRTEPWFCTLSLNLCHAPYNRPPNGLYTVDAYDNKVIATGYDQGGGAGPPVFPLPLDKGQTTDSWPYFKAMLQSCDIELARLLNSMDQETLENTMVIVFTDNGTPDRVGETERYPTAAPFDNELYDADHLKGTVYNPGINNPCWFYGAGVEASVDDVATTSHAMVNITDIFTTIMDVAGAGSDPSLYVGPAGTVDGVSVKGILDDRVSGTTTRTINYCELFENEDGANTGAVDGSKQIQKVESGSGDVYKLITFRVNGVATEELYNLGTPDPFGTPVDPREASVIATPYTGADLTAYDELVFDQTTLLASP